MGIKSLNQSLSKKRVKRLTKSTTAADITVAKVTRDAAIFLNRASYVIELDVDGNVLEDYSNPPFESLLDCIVVIAPIQFDGKTIKAIVLEIGISRFVPYKRTQIKTDKKDKKNGREIIYARNLVEPLSWEKTQKILPTLYKAIQFCVDSKMEKWTRARLIQSTRYTQNNSTYFLPYEAWIMIRIPKEYSLLYAILKIKDQIDRSIPNKNYDASSTLIAEEFIFFMKVHPNEETDYSDSVIKKSFTLAKIATRINKKIKSGVYTTRSIVVIKNLLRVKGGETFVLLFEKLFSVFDITEPKNDVFLDEHEFLLREMDALHLIDSCNIKPMVIHRCDVVRKIHASDCFSIAIVGSRDHLEKLDLRNTENRLRDSYGKNNKSDSDNDIPF
ncbi:MAG: hypothetical protein KBC41_03580 [Candidatus Pacebacteria bacterium]|nr:hypothetical protein [Candidatus Paceibacterota bacterium]MBP9867127.1 hypothetical protein [Candidatus Paceibacterota bacterium]